MEEIKKIEIPGCRVNGVWMQPFTLSWDEMPDNRTLQAVSDGTVQQQYETLDKLLIDALNRADEPVIEVGILNTAIALLQGMIHNRQQKAKDNA